MKRLCLTAYSRSVPSPRRRAFGAGAVILACLLVSPTLQAQDLDNSAAPANETTRSGTQTATVLPAESVGSDDLLEIMVPYCPELSRTFRVSSNGTLVLPLLKSPIPVFGLLPSEIAEKIKTALVQGGVMNDPVVSVSVTEYRSRPVSVIGAVNHPLTFQATGQTTLLDAIARAGGLTPFAGADILVTRTTMDAEGHMRRSAETVPVKSLLASADASLNLSLQGGEEIRIPEAGKIFVTGNVRRPGMYAMQGDADTTVEKALALSEGLQPYSSRIAYIYRRRQAGEQRQEIKVPLSEIIARKQPDVTLLADDIFYVPENGSKKMTSKVLSQIAGFGQTAATGLLIYH